MAMNKVVKRLLVGGAVVYGTHLAISPSETDFDVSRDYAPNPVQQEFIRLNAQKFSYVALGDTDHRSSQIKIFALHQKTLQALNAGGISHYFLEVDATEQPGIDRARALKKNYDYANLSTWTCDTKEQDALNKNFNESSSRLPNMKIIAADQRWNKVDIFEKLGPYQRFVYKKSMELYPKVYGCWTNATFVIPNVLTWGTAMPLLKKTVTDDTKTVGHMKTFSSHAAIFYGAGHYEDKGDVPSMRSLLTADHKTMSVLNVFKDAMQKKEYQADGKSADANLYVQPSASMPDGIEIVNPEIRPLYDQAKRNVAVNARKMALN